MKAKWSVRVILVRRVSFAAYCSKKMLLFARLSGLEIKSAHGTAGKENDEFRDCSSTI